MWGDMNQPWNRRKTLQRMQDMIVFALLSLAFNSACANGSADSPVQSPSEVSVMMQADRLPPAEIAPVVIGNTRYEVVHWGKERGLGQNGGYIAAVDVASGKEEWLLKIYDVEYDPALEQDVQDVFIKSMSKPFFSKKLKIVDELGRKFTVDTVSRSVEKD